MLQAIIGGGITFASSPFFRLGELSAIDAGTECKCPRGAAGRKEAGCGMKGHSQSFHMKVGEQKTTTNGAFLALAVFTTLRSKDVYCCESSCNYHSSGGFDGFSLDL